jgi:leader peptidase (prepilin peptidase)/N-methyltransferase
VTWFLDAALGAGAVGLATGALVPQLIARLPEPAPDPVPDLVVPADGETSDARPLEEVKELYAEVAACPGLRWRTATAGAVAAGLLGGRTGWDPALLFLLYLVPVCVALAVVDWHTRFLPTRLIAPSYLVVGALVVVAWLLTGDGSALVTAAIGWLGGFAFFFVQWYLYPRGLGYGDVRLSGLLGMALGWLGPVPLVLGIFVGFALGAVGGGLLSMLRVFNRKHCPFGPFMVLGALLGAVFPGELVAGYGWLVRAVASAFLAVADAF